MARKPRRRWNDPGSDGESYKPIATLVRFNKDSTRDKSNFLYIPVDAGDVRAISKRRFQELVQSGADRAEIAFELNLPNTMIVDILWRQMRIKEGDFLPPFKEKTRLNKGDHHYAKLKRKLTACEENKLAELREKKAATAITARPGPVTLHDPTAHSSAAYAHYVPTSRLSGKRNPPRVTAKKALD